MTDDAAEPRENRGQADLQHFSSSASHEPNRRELLRLGMGWGGLTGLGAGLILFDRGRAEAVFEPSSSDTKLIVRTLRPLNLESPVAALDTWLTPNDQFFVRSHFGAPATNLHPWELEIAGLVDRPARLSLDDLNRFEQITDPAVLQCAGNGRGLFRPRIPGIGWERGAVGHAEWSGVRLLDLLKQAGLKPGAAHVHLIGGDAPPTPKTPAFVRSLPLSRALESDTLIALRMNGEPLPALHGGPLRLIVPGWTGNNWLKWVRRIVVSNEEAPGFYMQTGYRLPTSALPGTPAAASGSEKPAPVTWMNVKSLITWPRAESTVAAGRVEIRGIAWTGQGHVTKVEFSTDRDPAWKPARLIGEPRTGSWRQFRADWEPTEAGRYSLRVRATDSLGQVQPETPPWNKSGYLWNGIDQIACVVR